MYSHPMLKGTTSIKTFMNSLSKKFKTMSIQINIHKTNVQMIKQSEIHNNKETEPSKTQKN